MSVTLLLRCNGCDAQVETAPWRCEYVPIGPTNFVQRRTPDVQTIVPDGWQMWDPYTLATYCPECWASIEGGTGADEQP